MKTGGWIVLSALVPALAGAAVLRERSTGATFEQVQEVGGQEYECLGTGVRKVFVVTAYSLAFCVESERVDGIVGDWVGKAHPGLQGSELRDALEEDTKFYSRLALLPADRLVVMKPARDLKRDQIAGAFRDSLSNVLSPEDVEKLMAAVPSDARKGETIRVYSQGDVLTIDIAGRVQTVEDPEISREIWRVWLARGGVSPTLRESLAENVAREASGGAALR